MSLLDRLEKRLAQPGDDETERSRKALGTVVLIAGILGTAFNMIPLLINGFSANMIIYGLLTLILSLATIAILTFPRYAKPIFAVVLLATISSGVANQVAFGGFASGVYAFTWALLGPIGAVLFVGMRFTLASLLFFMGALVTTAVLEPYAISIGPPITPAQRLMINVPSIAILCLMITFASLYLLRQVQRFNQRAETLLLNILPGPIAERLKQETAVIADGYNEVTVLFADIVDFTTMSSGADPASVVSLLNTIFSDFDDLAARHGLEKIKTIGDAYMVAAGLPEPRPDHAQAVVAFALEMLSRAGRYRGFNGEAIRFRVGINSGPVVAGVIGRQKFIYDLWGDAVNVASRMESNGLANEIQVTEAVKTKLEGQYKFTAREAMPIKGKGMMVTYLLEPPDLTGRPASI